MRNDAALLREVLPGGMMTTLPPGVATAFGAVLELLRREGHSSLSPKGLLTAYYTGWVSGEIAPRRIQTDPEAVRLLKDIIQDLQRAQHPLNPATKGGARDTTFDQPDPFEAALGEDDALQHLRPQIVPRALLQLRHWERQLRRRLVPESNSIPLGGHLAVQVAFDYAATGHRVVLLNEDAARLQLSAESAMRVAVANIEAVSPGPLERLSSGLLVAPWRDGYAATRLLLPDLPQRARVRGDLIAMVPMQDELLLSDAENESALAEMVERAWTSLDQPSFLSGIPLRFSGDGSWRSHIPSGPSAVAEQFRRLRGMTLRREYDAQFRALRDVERSAGRDPFIATLMVDHRSSHPADSTATWTKGVPALLPRADLIGFNEQLDGCRVSFHGLARWERVVARLAHLLERIDCYPERYRVQAFPTAAQLRQLELTNWAGNRMRQPAVVKLSAPEHTAAQSRAARDTYGPPNPTTIAPEAALPPEN